MATTTTSRVRRNRAEWQALLERAERAGLTHAQWWAHTRRTFERAIREQGLRGEAKRDYRLTHAKPVVEDFFTWAEAQVERAALLPSNPLTEALHDAPQRREALRVYLNDPDVSIDTNHLERALRPIPMGRKHWLFCWTEVGAEAVVTLQCLIVTCQLNDIAPYVYLVDVLQRIDHANSDMAVNAADAALYQAKAGGRDRVVVEPPT